MFLSFRIHELKRAFDQICRNFLHFLKNLGLKVIMFMRISCVQVSLKLTIRYFVGLFIFPIILSFFLNRIISQMNHLIHIINIIFFTTSPDIPFLIPIGPYKAIMRSQQYIMSDVELSMAIQEGLYILLNNQRFHFTTSRRLSV